MSTPGNKGLVPATAPKPRVLRCKAVELILQNGVDVHKLNEDNSVLRDKMIVAVEAVGSASTKSPSGATNAASATLKKSLLTLTDPSGEQIVQDYPIGVITNENTANLSYQNRLEVNSRLRLNDCFVSVKGGASGGEVGTAVTLLFYYYPSN